MPDYQNLEVSVAGGVLHFGMWGREGPVVLGSHGITGNHVTFAALADVLGDGVRLIVPDHRGRGRSNGIEGPFGMREHAADLYAVLDRLEIERADLIVGHSMGAFVAAVTAAENPTRVGALLLVDGGLPLIDTVPEGIDPEALVRGLLGPALDRLDRTFASPEAYYAFWRPHPAVGADWSAYVERYLDYDLVGEPPQLRSSVNKSAVLADAQNQLTTDVIPRSLSRLRLPVRFLRAPRGLMNGDPLYSEERVEAWAPRISGFQAITVPDVNHYTILLSARGAKVVGDEVRAFLA